MKKLLENGQEIIVPNGGPPKVRSAKPFAGHSFFFDDSPPGLIAVTFTLADANEYYYDYAGEGTDTASIAMVDRLNHMQPVSFRGTTGGRLFNAYTRRRVLHKYVL